MNIQAEVSLYPLRIGELGTALHAFLATLQESGLEVQAGHMSSMVTGEAETVFTAAGRAFSAAAQNHEVVLVLKASNACPSNKERNTDTWPH
ncbi:MAG: hypothetical protein GXY74_14710 [Phycisphaerae bacterium]|nr:hypothetical protein [Phycisphaerae bacterium]